MRCVSAVLFTATVLCAAEPIRLHPANPHYFLFRGKPAVLITGTEHYGAVLNLDFDYLKYLETLQKAGLNLTRTFTGAYREVPANFNIARNTLAPATGRFISPWPEVSPGKFDLKRWNAAYFRRLKDFIAQAGRRGVVVELSLFCPFYDDSMWEVSPQNAKNNVNGIGNLKRTEAYTLKNGELLGVQDALTRKIVSELKDADNVIYEICNEPYFGGVTIEWQHHIADMITSAEASFRNKHVIAQNIANFSAKVDNPHPAVSLFNFHYARPPEAVAVNYGLRKAIGFDETGFDGTADAAYRVEAWDFLLAGGATYDHLDYSFVAGQEDGTFQHPASQPGGGSPELRRQLRILKDFMESLDFVNMHPEDSVIAGGLPDGASARTLAGDGKQYAIYVHHGRPVKKGKPPYQIDVGVKTAKLRLRLPAGSYRAEWVNTKTGAVAKTEPVSASGEVVSPEYEQDAAVRIRRQ